MIGNKYLSVLLLTIFAVAAQSFYIYVDYTSPKCLIEQVDANVPIVLYYKNSDFYIFNDLPESDSKNVDNVHVTVYDPDQEVVYEGRAKETGKFVFTPFKKGDYKICLQIQKGQNNEMNPQGGEFRFYFDIKKGLEQTNTATIAKASNLLEAEEAIQKLTTAIHDMKNELEYQNDEEQKIRDNDDNANNKIIIWTCLEAFILILVAMWQVYSITSFLSRQ